MAGVMREGGFLEQERDQCNMAGIHGLDGESLAVDLDVDHLDQFLEGVDDLAEDGALLESGLEHLCLRAGNLLFD